MLTVACGEGSDDEGLQGGIGAGTEQKRETFTSEEMGEGVEIRVSEGDNTVQRAVAFHPLETPDFEIPEEHLRELSEGSAVVVREGLRDFDLTVVYRTGPYCGLLPDTEQTATDPPTFAVDPGNKNIDYQAFSEEHGLECPDMEFDEAVGFDLMEGVDADEVEVRVVGRE